MDPCSLFTGIFGSKYYFTHDSDSAQFAVRWTLKSGKTVLYTNAKPQGRSVGDPARTGRQAMTRQRILPRGGN